MRAFFPILVLTVVTLTGCSTYGGAGTLTGTARPAISIEAVKVYATPPEKFQEIGLVTSQSNSYTVKAQNDNLIKYLKEEAAKLGANGIIVDRVLVRAGWEGNAQARAIWIENKN